MEGPINTDKTNGLSDKGKPNITKGISYMEQEGQSSSNTGNNDNRISRESGIKRERTSPEIKEERSPKHIKTEIKSEVKSERNSPQPGVSRNIPIARLDPSSSATGAANNSLNVQAGPSSSATGVHNNSSNVQAGPSNSSTAVPNSGLNVGQDTSGDVVTALGHNPSTAEINSFILRTNTTDVIPAYIRPHRTLHVFDPLFQGERGYINPATDRPFRNQQPLLRNIATALEQGVTHNHNMKIDTSLFQGANQRYLSQYLNYHYPR